MELEGAKNIHPFFKRRSSHDHDDAVRPAKEADIEERSELNPLDDAQHVEKKTRSKKENRSKSRNALRKTSNGTNAEFSAVRRNEQSDDSPGVDDDGPRTKRRRTSEQGTQSVGDEVVVQNSIIDLGMPTSLRSRSPQVIIARSPTSSVLPDEARDVSMDLPGGDKPATPPKKLLRLNASGKFSSPISRQPKENILSPQNLKRRGRPRKIKDIVQPKRLVVKLSYSNAVNGGDSLGEKIRRILAGEMRVSSPDDKPAKRPRTPSKVGKATHPFFLGKAANEAVQPKAESPRKASTSTPGKLKAQIWGDRLPAAKDVPHTVGSALLKDRLMVKHPGAEEPPWPDHSSAHVRGIDNIVEVSLPAPINTLWFSKRRKRKTAQLPIPPHHSVLRSFGGTLLPEVETVTRPDGFNDPSPSLRVPERLLLNGLELRQRLAHELATNFSTPSSATFDPHPALQKLWASLPASFTAWDESRGENLTWNQKHIPTTVADVLQPPHELAVLKDWLKSLTVTSVESTSNVTKPVVRTGPKPKKRRRKRNEEMDGFLVDSDEDIQYMSQVSESDTAMGGLPGQVSASLVQVCEAGMKLNNAVLLSGPHGCGKTAAAYAVARELGFKVFEISANERRSGKDVLERIGDMTENHLVQHRAAEETDLSSTEDAHKARLDEAFHRDLASGRQGKMNSFFKPQPTGKSRSGKSSKAQKPAILKAVQEALKKPQKDQQQSVILLEEVDVLFKDDKDFWGTVLKLVTSSKRPFIMTCNDEDLVPLQAISLHAILRFTPPPADLATDYLLLVAAAEGHLLRRDAVSSLYSAKRGDLRASISELNLWCQMGVGDPRGGLSWIYQRWPPDSDVDKQGRKLRVISQDTYQRGMSLRPDDVVSTHDRLMWNWREYGQDPMELSHLSLEARARTCNTSDGASALKHFVLNMEMLSTVDHFCSAHPPETSRLDPTQPEMTEKANYDYIEGLPLLQTDERVDHSAMSAEIVVTTIDLLSRLNETVDALMSLPDTINHQNIAKKDRPLTRRDFAVFDAISVSPDPTISHGQGLTQSAFDGPIATIATELAPYVRSIVQYDLALEEERERLKDFLDEGYGHKSKRARTTRAARSALEGGQRASTRRERWFSKTLNLASVLGTGGSNWPKTSVRPAEEHQSVDGADSVTSADCRKQPLSDNTDGTPEESSE